MKRLSVVLALCGFIAVPFVTAQTPAGSLLIISKANHTVAVVDPATLKIKAKAPTGEDPHEVIASSDGRTVYISNYGGGSLHTIQVIDLTTVKARTPIELGPLSGPHGLDFVNGKLWFTAEGAKVVGRYDPASGKVDTVIGTGQNRTHMIWVTPDEKHIIATNVASGTLSFIDQVPAGGPPPMPPGGNGPSGQPGPRPGPPPGMGPHQDWNQTVVKVGNGSEGFDVSPDGREVWNENGQDGTVSVTDIASKKVVATIPIDAKMANRLKFTPDGKYALVSAGADLVVLDTKSRTVFKRVPIGTGDSEGILIEPGGHRAFVACTGDNYVAVIDLSNFSVAGHIDVGPNPDGMAWVPAK